MVLPELGGRIHSAYDRVADYDLFYRNTVIKAALVGSGRAVAFRRRQVQLAPASPACYFPAH